MIRTATIHDVPRMQAIINSHAELGKMLFKSFAQLYESLRDFAVAERDGKVVGCTALTIIWADLAEIRSLAVDNAWRGRGVGRELVEWTIQEASRLQIRRIMSLTYEQAFFERLGFEVVPKDSLPIVGFPERRPDIYVTVMHSGVTLGPLIGRLAAMEILDGVRVDPLAPYRIERFR